MEIKWFCPYKRYMIMSIMIFMILIMTLIIVPLTKFFSVLGIWYVLALFILKYVYDASLIKVIYDKQGIIYIGHREKYLRIFQWNDFTNTYYYTNYRGFTFVILSSEKIEDKQKKAIVNFYTAFSPFFKNKKLLILPMADFSKMKQFDCVLREKIQNVDNSPF